MKNKIKVYLQYPWKYADSPYYKYLLQEVSPGIRYTNVKNMQGATHNPKKLKFLYNVKKYLRIFTNKLNLLIPNARLSPKGDYDLIHCAHCLSKNKDKPWIADVECSWSFFISGANSKKGLKKVEKYLLRKNCKKILPWTEQTKKELEQKFPSIKDKLEVVYPAIPFQREKINKPKNKINLIFSARYFFQKGGLHALEAMDRLTKKYKNVYGIFISEIPKEIFKRYSSNKKIKFLHLVPQKELFKLYKKAHILLYPGYSDSFGFGFLEAMNFGIPIISVKKNARNKIVESGKTGFLIDVGDVYGYNREKIGDKEKKVIQGLMEQTEKLIKNKNLLNKMSKNCLKEIKEGKFSIKERNKKLKKIYEGAIR